MIFYHDFFILSIDFSIFMLTFFIAYDIIILLNKNMRKTQFGEVMRSNLLREIKSNLEFMSSVERKIADTILLDPKKVTSRSLSEFSKIANVSQGSIINFANKFCGGGFSALKIEIASSLAQVADKPFSPAKNSDSMEEILRKTSKDIGDALDNTCALNNSAALNDVVNMILEAKKVEIYGIFRSAVVATDFYYQIIQLGVPATFVSDVLTCALSASMLDSDSLVIAISSSGETQDIIDAVNLAKANNVPVICITSNKVSPLAKISDKVLIAAPSGNSVSANASEIRISQLALTDAICSYLRSRIEGYGRTNYFKLNGILSMHNVRD